MERYNKRKHNLEGKNIMSMLTLAQAKEILSKHTTEQHLFVHAAAVRAAMGAMAEHFGEDKAYWEAIGYLHDVDFEKFPQQHCHHVRELLANEPVDEEDMENIIAHGYGICTEEVQPSSNLQKSLFAVDELTGIIHAYSLMRPEGMEGMEVKSLKKKFKDKKFAAKCNREIIKNGVADLGMDLGDVMACCIKGMNEHKAEFV